MVFLSVRNKLQQNKLMLENSDRIILFFNRDGRITDCNKVAMRELGYEKELKKLRVQDIFRNAVIYEEHKLKVLAGREKPEETFAYRKNQTCFPVELKLSIYSRTKRFQGICIAKNISEYKEVLHRMKLMENEIECLKSNRNEITANVTHELRTPINGILGLSNNLLDTPLQPDQVDMVQLIKRCCINMESMINDLLDYAKLTNYKMVLEQREFSFREFIHSVVKVNRPMINEKGLNLLLYIADDIPDRVIGDEFRLSQILNNLLSNAVKFTTVGHITLEVAKLSQTNQSVELFFILIDTGIGISAEDKDKLFQSFSQVDGSITRRFGGTGLGLAISKKLVEAMGGMIGVDSERGKGSTFSFSVRLGIPTTGQDSEASPKRKEIPIDYRDKKESSENASLGKNTQETNYFRYIDQLLMDAGSTFRDDGSKALSREEILGNMRSVVEKLLLCIEMESWDKAEELAYFIKSQLTADFEDVSKIVFRLLLAVRKENYETSIALIHELKIFINEMV